MRNPVIAVAAALSFAFAATAAFAHADLEKSTPAAGATVASPTELRLEFEEGVEPKFTGLTLTGPAGKAELGAATYEGAEKNVLVVPVAKPLAPGAYTVKWHNVSTDSHRSQGTFHFSVK